MSSWEKTYRHLLDTTRQVLPNVQFVLCTPFYTPARGAVKCAVIDSLGTIVRQIARDYHAVFVPFDSMFKELQKSQPTPKYWIWDGVHPTAAGHQRMAALWESQCHDLILSSPFTTTR